VNYTSDSPIVRTSFPYKLPMVYLLLYLLLSERKLAERGEIRLFLVEIKERRDVLPLPLPLAHDSLSKPFFN
jgi:hypothetical protein